MLGAVCPVMRLEIHAMERWHTLSIHHNPQTAAGLALAPSKSWYGALVLEETAGRLEQVTPSIGHFNAPVLAPENQKIITHLRLANLFRQGRLREAQRFGDNGKSSN